MEIKQRRYSSTLAVAGLGYVFFGLWSMVKIIMYLSLENGFSTITSGVEQQDVSHGIIILFVVAFLGIDLFFRLFVGLSARAEGKGIKKGNAYIVLGFIFLAYNIYVVFFTFFNSAPDLSALDTALSLIIDISALIVLCDILITAIKLKKVQNTRQLKG